MPAANFVNGVATVRVPPGKYTAVAALRDCLGAGCPLAFVGDTEIDVTADTTLEFDGRTADPITVDVRTHNVAPVEQNIGWGQWDAQGRLVGGAIFQSAQPYELFAAETEPVTTGTFEFFHRQVLVDPVLRFNGPVVIDADYVETGRIPDDLTYVIDEKALETEFSRDHSEVATNTPQAAFDEIRFFVRPWVPLAFGVLHAFTGPLERESHTRAVSDSLVLRAVRQFPSGPGALVGGVQGQWTDYTPGEDTESSWFRGPFHPTFVVNGRIPLPTFTTRTARTSTSVRTNLTEFTDADPTHVAYTNAFNPVNPFVGLQTAFRLYQDGTLIASQAKGSGTFNVAPGDHELRLEMDTTTTSNHDWSQRSTATKTAWTVQSPEPEGTAQTVLPLLHVDYDVPLNLRNVLDRPGVSPIKFQVRHQDGATAAKVERLKVWFSIDDGQKWIPALVLKSGGAGNYWTPFPVLPHRQQEISIKVEAWDSDGNRIQQEITRAFGINTR